MTRLPRGFAAAGLHCGIKSNAEKPDLAVFLSDRPAAASGVFTRNLVQGAPVHVSRDRVPRETARGVVVNSGNANACTGERGLDDARWMTAEIAQLVGTDEHPVAPEDVLVCSTGIIGRHLPREALASGFPRAVTAANESPESLELAARGMMTTDTFPKLAEREVEVNGTVVRVTGVGKGAAMIAPNMGTMLAVVMTDAELSPARADALLRNAVDHSFNCISIEGDTSTSDTVLLLANGAAECGELSEDGLVLLGSAIREVCTELATMIVRDAEGAEHFVTIDVAGTRTFEEAHRIAKTIAESPLVKTGITGNDPNWGRVLACVGRSGIDVVEEDVSLAINGTAVYTSGSPVPFDAAALSAAMSTGEVSLELQLDHGSAACRFWTCDLTAEYVRLNSEYTT